PNPLTYLCPCTTLFRSDSAFYQVLRTTKAPVIASHSSCRKFTPGWQRNMSDEMIKALAKNGGVIHINFGTTFLDSDIKKSAEKLDRKSTRLNSSHVKIS